MEEQLATHFLPTLLRKQPPLVKLDDEEEDKMERPAPLEPPLLTLPSSWSQALRLLKLGLHQLSEVQSGPTLSYAFTYHQQHIASIQLFWRNVFRASIFVAPPHSHSQPNHTSTPTPTPDSERFFQIENVLVSAYHEPNVVVSSYGVFVAISQHSMVAAHHYTQLFPQSSTLALLHLVRWLHSYRDLYHQACRGCSRHLRYHSQELQLLPPTIRTHLHHHPYHPHCLAHAT
eukprot:TRINITY_DN7790_c0_g1_i3.p1 TRINITY_DN7790_c0_g1~~TRINITY_DN7790_c0_g1_i3.p1  ORF type:complete len:231 (+),score=42.52 TRINITY_DN7790_c0_g1_i3:408-1100(+)